MGLKEILQQKREEIFNIASKHGAYNNRLTNEYLNVDLNIVWNVIENYLRPLEETIEAMAEKFWNS